MAVSSQKLLLEIQIKNQQALGRVERDVNKLANSSKGLGINLRTAAAALGAFATGRLVKNIISTTARFQDLRTTLKSTTGSAEAGAEAFQFINDFATRTQFSVEDLTTTFIKLKTAGIEPTEELLTTFTDAAAVTTDQIGSLEAITDLFARTVSGGLGLEELNRLADRGIPVFRILEEELGLTRLQISEFGKTAEGARKITEALGKGINERFGGATQNLLGNLSVAFSNLQIELARAADTFGQGLSPVIIQATEDITRFVNQNQQNLKDLGAAFGVFAEFVIKNIDNITIAVLGLNAIFARSPLGRIVSGFLALGVGAVKLYNYLLKTNPELAKVLKNLIDIGKEKDNLEFDEGDVGGDGFFIVKKQSEQAKVSVEEYTKAVKQAFGNEVNKGLENYKMNLSKLLESYTLSATITDTLTKATNTFATTAESALTDVVLGTKTLEDALGEIGRAILRDLIGGFIRLLVVGPILDFIANKLGLTQNDQLKREKAITRELQKQIGLRLILAAIGGGGGGGFSFFANGGRIDAGEVGIVGERGPELFIPDTAGTIVPNRDIQSGSEGGQLTSGNVTVNLNINAVDAASFDELLLSRKNLIVGTIQQAFKQSGRRFA